MGGEISSVVLNQMNPFGRTSVCGSISVYNAKVGEYPLGKQIIIIIITIIVATVLSTTPIILAPVIQPALVFKQLKVEGFIFSRWIDRWDEAVQTNVQWIREGKLKYKEKVTDGFDKSFDAFVDMLQGGNLGKAVVKIK